MSFITIEAIMRKKSDTSSVFIIIIFYDNDQPKYFRLHHLFKHSLTALEYSLCRRSHMERQENGKKQEYNFDAAFFLTFSKK